MLRARLGDMASTRTQSIKTVAIIVILVVALVGGVYAFMQWQNSRPAAAPHEVTVTATVGETEVETTPYMVCEPGVECPENEVPTVQVSPDDTVRIEVPKDIYDHDWQLLTIYDDPGANDQQLHGPNDTNTVDIPVSASPVGDSTEHPQLVVVEVSSIMIGHDDAGVETPYMTTWSFSFE
ncbi:putative secreted protein [Corynebacterium pilosum]|uniref:Putative secreted protein n=2 Tax=Corynebacterium pilosum TaxID=35756 RepID=A0A376CNS6_9CORY|nr:putative secreted protein [Corynebacterium pilosum]